MERLSKNKEETQTMKSPSIKHESIKKKKGREKITGNPTLTLTLTFGIYVIIFTIENV
jgi:hypothetical protein